MLRRAIAVLATAMLAACGARTDVAVGGGDGQGQGEGGGPDGSGGDTAIPCPVCAPLGWACGSGCCDGTPCATTPDGGQRCGGVSPGGVDTACSLEDDRCHWVPTTLCPEQGPIRQFCGANATAAQLQRCDGTCYVPDEIYLGFYVRSCDSEPTTPCPYGNCGGVWEAVLCCDNQ